MSITFYATDSTGKFSCEEQDCLNVTGRNADAIASSIAMEISYDNPYWDAKDVYTRCHEVVMLLTSIPELDKGRKTTVIEEPGKITIIDMAMSDGYLTNRLAILRGIAARAISMGGKIFYC